jgi:hypothetical protein
VVLYRGFQSFFEESGGARAPTVNILVFFKKKMEYLEATNQETEGIKENQSKPTDYIRFCVH